MRILHVLDHSLPLHSGYAFRTNAILTAQRATGWETLQVTSPKQGQVEAPFEDIDGFRYLRTAALDGAAARWTPLNAISVMRALRRRLDEIVTAERPDVLHAHSPVLNALPTIAAGHRHGLPVVYEMRANWEDAAVDHGTAKPGGLRYKLSRALETHALKKADAITTICAGLRDDIVGRGIPHDKVTIIPNAVALEHFSISNKRDPDLAQRHIGDAYPVLGFIGSFYGYEGLGVLLEATAQLIAKLPKLKLLLVGGGPKDAELRTRSEALGLQDHVVFTGRVPHDDVDRYYSLIDLLVYPRLSTRLTEMVTPLKPLEAMAKAQAVMASDVGGHRELIEPGKTGFLFPPGDPDALAASVLSVFEQGDRLAAVRSAGRRFVEEERTWQSSVARYGPVYNALLGR